MGAVHATTALQSSSGNNSGSSTVSSWSDVTAAYQAVVLAKVINGTSGPTLGCTVSLDLSPDNGTTIYLGAGGSATAGATNSFTYAYQFELPPGTMYVRSVFSGNTTQAVTIQADVTKLTGI